MGVPAEASRPTRPRRRTSGWGVLPLLAVGCLFDAGQRDARRDELGRPAPTTPAPAPTPPEPTPPTACPGGASLVETWPDGDGDGRGDASVPPDASCPGAAGRAGNDGDCDDHDPDLPGPLYADRDEDGVGGDRVEPGCPGPGFATGGGDCDDRDPAVTALVAVADDLDLDGFGAPGTTEDRCVGAATGFATNEDDCDDGDATRFPVELFVDLDGDGLGGDAAFACPAPGLVAGGGDCDDGDSRVRDLLWGDGDGDGHGAGPAITGCPTVDVSVDDLDCDDGDPAIPILAWDDGDGDGFGLDGTASWRCVGGAPDGGDCDDGDPLVHPGAEDDVEFGGAPAVDEDCDGVTPICGLHLVPAGVDNYQAELDAACPGDVFELAPHVSGVRTATHRLDRVAGLTVRAAPGGPVEIDVGGASEPAFFLDDDHLVGLVIRADRPTADGGAVEVAGPATLTDVTFDGVHGADGGCLYAHGADGLVLDGVQFLDCLGARGGAAYVVDSADVVVTDAVLGCPLYQPGVIVAGFSFDRSPGASFTRLVAGGCSGAAVDLDASTPASFEDSDFTGNDNGGGGGAIQLQGTAATVTGSRFVGNSSNVSGGAIYADAASPLVVTGGGFDGNSASTAAGYTGGAIEAHADLDLVDVEFFGNTAGDGGAVGAVGGGRLWVSGGSFDQNEARADLYGTGGALLVRDSRDARVDGATFTDNTAEYAGGGVAVSGGELRCQSCRFDGDGAQVGGGIHAELADLELGATAFVDDSASYGHALVVEAGGDVLVTDGVFSVQRDGIGGVVEIPGADTVVFRRTAFADLDSGFDDLVEVTALDITFETVTGLRLEGQRIFDLHGDATLTNVLVADDSRSAEGLVCCEAGDCVLDFVTLVADAGPAVLGDDAEVTLRDFVVSAPVQTLTRVDLATWDVASGVLDGPPAPGIVLGTDVDALAPSFVDPPDDYRLVPGSGGADEVVGCADLDGSACDWGAFGGPLAVP